MSKPILIQKDTSSFGTASLFQNGDIYQLEDGNSGNFVTLTFQNNAATTKSLGPWHAVGAMRTQNGYEVAFKNAATGQFTAWYTDRKGNYTGGTDTFSANSPVLEKLETTFNQDLNGDGTIGLPAGTTLIQTDKSALGSTSLVLVGNTYHLENADTGAGPVLQIGNSAATTDFLASWHAIGAVQTSTGYDVAFKNSATGLYTAWYTDANGNFTGGTDVFSAKSPVLEKLETTFNQDLNGDGTIGLPAGTTLIHTDTNQYGSISLVQVGDTFKLENAETGVGPVLQYGNIPITAGSLKGWHVLGAAQTATGYEVAFANSATGQFNVGIGDKNGNTAAYSGLLTANSAVLLAYETSFNQDLNGDGKIGLNLAANHA